jgi:hypothetical protein
METVDSSRIIVFMLGSVLRGTMKSTRRFGSESLFPFGSNWCWLLCPSQQTTICDQTTDISDYEIAESAICVFELNAFPHFLPCLR